MTLGQAQEGISEINAQRLAEQRNSAENNPLVREQYNPADYENEQQEFVVDEARGSGLDNEGFPIEIESYEVFRALIKILEGVKTADYLQGEVILDERNFKRDVKLYSFDLNTYIRV